MSELELSSIMIEEEGKTNKLDFDIWNNYIDPETKNYFVGERPSDES